MKVTVHFYQLNRDFSPEHAEAHHNGEESENNLKYDWEDELEVSENLQAVQLIRKGVFTLQGQYPDGTVFSEDIPNMLLIEMTLTDGQKGYMGASESMVANVEQEGSAEHVIFNVFLKDYEPCWNEMPGVFIASKDFPKSIKLHDRD